jgi:serine/threonine-protein kinase RsbW
MHKKTFPARIDQLHGMLNFIQIYGKNKQIPSLLLDKIILAAEEALVNVINYGYPDENGTIDLSCEETGLKPGLRILIKDYGIPFNPINEALIKKKKPLGKQASQEKKSEVEENQIPKEDHQIGGYGIYIFVGIMDCVEYKRMDGGNVLSLIKYL